MTKVLFIMLAVIFLAAHVPAQEVDAKAEEVMKKAVAYMGGDAYLKIRTQYARGKFSVLQKGMASSFQAFTDIIVAPNKNRTDFREFGRKTIQVIDGDGGWYYNENLDTFGPQTPKQLENYRRGLLVSLDNFLRRGWQGKAKLEYAGRREASLGKRNDVLRLTYNEDEFVVEFEFSAEGIPMKNVYKTVNLDGNEVKAEDRYAQWVDVQGVKFPFVIDHFEAGEHLTRINYESMEINRKISDEVFKKPEQTKDMKKELRKDPKI